MFEVTHLGWQSWLVNAGDAAILIDPLFPISDRHHGAIGRGDPPLRQRLPCWPPRRFDLGQMPPIAAIVITHEHEDHFDPLSLAFCARDIPVLLSERSSDAPRTLLSEMGFTQVRPLIPGAPVALGPLGLHAFDTGAPAADAFADEWDVLAPMVTAQSRDGNFFSNVDAPLTTAMLAAVSEAERGSGTGTLACLDGQVCQFTGAPPAGPPSAAPDDPLALLAAGGGLRPEAGHSFGMEAGVVTRFAARAPAVASLPRAEWPPQPAFWPATPTPLAPGCGTRALGPGALEELEAGLARLSTWMYGGPFFRWLLALAPRERGERAARFTWLLLAGDDEHAEDEAYAFAYIPQRGGFVPADPDAPSGVGTVVSWASDVGCLFRGEVEPRTLTPHMAERWTCKPGPRLRLPFAQWVLWPFFHPLRDAVAMNGALAQYRRLLAGGAPAPAVFAAGRGGRA